MSEKLLRRGIDAVHQGVVHPYLTHGEAQQDREIAHERALGLAEWVQRHRLAMNLANSFFTYRDPLLHTDLAGLFVPNPLGVAAGFDKNARIHGFLGKGQGFGFVTVGSITDVPYDGNPRPRIFDLPQSDGVINRMGFPGDGVDQAEKRLESDDPNSREYVLAINLAASRPSFERRTAIEDYVGVAKRLLPYGEVHEINVSSPNTLGVRGLQEPDMFKDLAQGMKQVYEGEDGRPDKLYTYKFGPDLGKSVLERDVMTAIDNGAAGITLTNTTTDADIKNGLANDQHRLETGGISGRPLRDRALEVSHMVSEYTGGTLPIIRAGGIATVKDVWEALTYGGATLTEVYTAYVRQPTSTPNFTYYILSQLAQGMRADNMQGMEDFKALRGRKIRFPNIN